MGGFLLDFIIFEWIMCENYIVLHVIKSDFN